jgi:hypothetical protein
MGSPSFNSPTSLEDEAQDQLNAETNAAELAEETAVDFDPSIGEGRPLPTLEQEMADLKESAE